MRILLLSAIIPFCFVAGAQRIEETYGYNFKPTTEGARYYVVTEKKDSLWHRKAYYIPERSLAMEAWYADKDTKMPHGIEKWYHANKRLMSVGNYVNGKMDGPWLYYDEEGFLRDSINYKNGYKTGTSMGWYKDGMPSDSLHFDGMGNGVEVGFHTNGFVARTGRWVQDTLRSGRWQYFSPEEKLTREEDYANGKVTKNICYNPDGSLMDTSLCKEIEAVFVGGGAAWKNFLIKNLRADVPLKKRAPAGSYTVIAQFVIDKEGNVTDVKALTNYGYGMEEEVVRLLKKSPQWKPAFQYGRYVKAYKKQPITFIVPG